MDPTETSLEAVAAEEHAQDHATILAGTGQNIAGLAVFVIASFGMNILLARAFGKGSAALGQITVATQLAFVIGAATRFGMDMAAVRRVAIEIGQRRASRVRSIVRIAVRLSLAISVFVGVVLISVAGPIHNLLHVPSPAFRAAGIAVIFVAVAQVYLGGSRGLKIMSHTLYSYWIGQSISWIVLTLAGWAVFSKTVAVTVSAYAASWVFATAVAAFFWLRQTRSMGSDPAEPHELAELIAYGAPRAPAALLSQALFYTDLFVLSAKLPPGDPRLSVYAASVRVAQALVLFLTAVSYMFSPFAADLHERGQRDRLDELFKSITRWTLAGTVPLLLLFAVAPDHVLKVFGSRYDIGSGWLRTLLIGQIVNVSVGAAGFVLIMVKRTGWDLIVYVSSFVVDLSVALTVIPHLGPEGAAVAQATTLVFSNVFRLLLVRRFVGIWPYDKNYARLLIPTAIAAVAMIAIHGLVGGGPKWGVDLLATGILGGLVYYLALVLFGLKLDEREALLRSLRKRPDRSEARPTSGI